MLDGHDGEVSDWEPEVVLTCPGRQHVRHLLDLLCTLAAQADRESEWVGILCW